MKNILVVLGRNIRMYIFKNYLLEHYFCSVFEANEYKSFINAS